MPADRRAGRIFADESLGEFISAVGSEGCGTLAERQKKFRDRWRWAELEAFEFVTPPEMRGAAFRSDTSHDHGAEIQTRDQFRELALFIV